MYKLSFQDADFTRAVKCCMFFCLRRKPHQRVTCNHPWVAELEVTAIFSLLHLHVPDCLR